MRVPVCICPTCRDRADAARDGQRCDTWGCPGRYEATLFPDAPAGTGPAADRDDGWTRGHGGRIHDGHYLFDTTPYARTGDE